MVRKDNISKETILLTIILLFGLIGVFYALSAIWCRGKKIP